MNAIKNWLSQYNNVTHAMIAILAFLVAAYDAVPVFHTFVLQIYHGLPGWVEQIIVVILAVYAWYRKGEPATGPVDGANTLKLNT
jgi:hypothetical protein